MTMMITMTHACKWIIETSQMLQVYIYIYVYVYLNIYIYCYSYRLSFDSIMLLGDLFYTFFTSTTFLRSEFQAPENPGDVTILQIWVFPQIMVPPNHPFNLIGFSIINHPFWGTPIFGNTHISYVFPSSQM